MNLTPLPKIPDAKDLSAQLSVAKAQIEVLTVERTRLQKLVDTLTQEVEVGALDRRRLQTAEKELERLTSLVGKLQEINATLSQKLDRIASQEPGKLVERFGPGQRISTDPNLVEKGKPGSVEDLSKPAIVIDTVEDKGVRRTTIWADVGKTIGVNVLASDGNNVFVRFTTQTDPHALKEGKGAVQVKSTIGMVISKDMFNQLIQQATTPSPQK